MKTANHWLRPLKNDQGIAALGMAMITILVVAAISVTLPRYLAQSSNATKDYRRQMQFQWILTQIGQIAYGAHQTGLRYPIACPALTTLRVVDGQRFCFPNGGNCVTHPQLSTPVCINFGALTASLSKENGETQITLNATTGETLAQSAKRHLLKASFAAYDIIGESLNILPSARAFDDTFGQPPIPGAAATNNQVRVPACPGHNACVRCSDPLTHCIRIRICDPHKTGGCTSNEDYYYQRIAIYDVM